MKNEYKVSIVVPVYNVLSYLERCIISLLNQTYENIEIIVINDGSTDGSEIICNDLSKMDKRIKVYHKENGGLSDARNLGLEKCTGNYIAFVDGDDYVASSFVENLVYAAVQERADIVVGSFCLIYDSFDEKKYIYRRNSSSIKEVYNSYESQKIFLESIIDTMECKIKWEYSKIRSNVCDKLFKKDIFDGIQFPFGKTSEDLWVIYELLKKSSKTVLIDAGDYYYFQREGSIMHNINAEVSISEIEAYEYFYQIECNLELKSKISLILLRLCIQRYRNICLYHKNEEYKNYIRRIVKQHVWNAKGGCVERLNWILLAYFPKYFEKKGIMI